MRVPLAATRTADRQSVDAGPRRHPHPTAGRSRLDTFLQQIVNGLTLGSVYAIVALGYTMVYGIIQLINFAHGEVVMIGAMVPYYGDRRADRRQHGRCRRS